MTDGRRKRNWETTSKRIRNDEEGNIDLRNDKKKTEREVIDEK